MQSFIPQANEFGKARRPFFFLIDFERKMPLICPLSQAAEQGIFFSLGGRQNIEPQAVTQPLQWDKTPLSPARYRQGFSLVQQELQRGNSYLLNLTYPTEIHTNYGLEQLFHAADAPYKLWLKNRFVCFSPERFVQIQGGKIYTYPMKGTRDADEPDAERKLLEDEKERREHYTVVDLMRNDLAMVAQNIRVTRFRYIDRIQTEKGEILQTSSEICGELDKNWREKIGSILTALLPAGSVSGAPKEKTVQIIRQAEGQARGYYT